MALSTDVHTVKQGTHLADSEQDESAYVASLLAVVGDMPSRITEGDGKAAAVVEFAEGLRSLADDLDPPE